VGGFNTPARQDGIEAVTIKDHHSPQVLERKMRQAKFLTFVGEGDPAAVACRRLNMSYTTYLNWRKRYVEFGPAVDQARRDAISRRQAVADARNPSMRTDAMKEWSKTISLAKPALGQFDFAAERRVWFGMMSPWFHLQIIDAYMTLPPGSILLVLVPPEHGKTTLFEDYASLKLDHDPEWRCMVGSEKQDFSKKIVGRVKTRMDPEMSKFPLWIERHGPFKPEKGGIWNALYFDVDKRKGEADERNFNMEAIGFGSAVAGNRTDHLHIDDPQSLKSLNQTQKMVDEFRQDWLTRPGETGITTINGTRVGDDDFYIRMIEELEGTAFDDLLRVVKYPAVMMVDNPVTGVPERQPLWPEKWSLHQLDRMRAKVGEDAWSRGYMQNPRSRTTTHFDENAIMECFNPERRMFQPDPKDMLVVTLDPAIGSRNAMMAMAFHGNSCVIHGIREDTGLRSNEEIMAALAEFIGQLRQSGAGISDICIEAMNFQAGLSRDQRLQEIARECGATTREHLTGINKYDENIGITSMAHTFRRHEFDFPWHPDDEYSRYWVEETKRQLLAWKPATKGRTENRGNKLRQDLVMALWFGWIVWRDRRGQQIDAKTLQSQFTFSGSPYAATETGLIVPVGANLALL
jgi:hypothetical protein